MCSDGQSLGPAHDVHQGNADPKSPESFDVIKRRNPTNHPSCW
nr:hypothetical protein [uncultured bacterium]